MNGSMNTIVSISELEKSGFMDQLLALSNSAKRQVIHILIDSMLDNKKNSATSNLNTSNRTQMMLSKFAGAWVGEESTDELMCKIRENSSIREPLHF